MNKLIDKAPELIREAAKSPLGVLALTIFLISILALAFFTTASELVKVIIFVLILVGAVLFVMSVLRLSTSREQSDNPKDSAFKQTESTKTEANHLSIPQSPQRASIISSLPSGNIASKRTADLGIVSPMIPFDWVTIPAGRFPMGSDKEQDRYAANNEKKHMLYLLEFHIARVPVTVAQFRHFVAATHYITTAEKQGWTADLTGTKWQPERDAYWESPHGLNSDVQEDHPVTCISWYDAVEFCRWAVVRLPTEAEWEKAAAYDTGSQVKYIYPWGNELPDKSRCNFDMQIGDTTPVKRYPPGVNALYDIAGNVWEWTSSLYDKYPYEADDREDPQAEGDRVVRGGSWYQPAKYIRCANRHWHMPDATVTDFGFRVCALKGNK